MPRRYPPAPYDKPPLLVREGSVVALNVAEQHFAARADRRGFAIFPVTEGWFVADVFDDDGESAVAEGPPPWRVEVACTPTDVTVVVRGGAADIVLPATETRRVTVTFD